MEIFALKVYDSLGHRGWLRGGLFDEYPGEVEAR